MDGTLAKPAMSVRLRRAGVWCIPFVVLVILRKFLNVSDGMFAMPANGVPPTRFDDFMNLATAGSLWLGLAAFLARLVWDDSPGLAVILIGLVVFLFAPILLYVLFT